MICEKCKKESQEEFTSKENKMICKECLEKEIYKTRKEIIKKNKKKGKRMDKILINIFIVFSICYAIIMIVLLIKEWIK